MVQPQGGLPTFHLFPCMIHVAEGEQLITTLLGSCVAVCLRDSVRQVGGVNHYMLSLWNGGGLPTPQYGNIAIQKLIRNLLDRGCSLDRLEAKIFGGAAVIRTDQGHFCIGERNIAIAREMLSREHIPIAAEDVGGNRGRKVIYNTGTGVALVARLQPAADDSFALTPVRGSLRFAPSE